MSIPDTGHPELHKVKTAQNRAQLQRSASLRRAADSLECCRDGKLTDTNVAMSSCDRCLLKGPVSEGRRAESSSYFLSDCVCVCACVWMRVCVYYTSLSRRRLYTGRAHTLTHPSDTRGCGSKPDRPMRGRKGVDQSVGRRR